MWRFNAGSGNAKRGGQEDEEEPASALLLTAAAVARIGISFATARIVFLLTFPRNYSALPHTEAEFYMLRGCPNACLRILCL